ncbi:MAG TPA: hypothetical protein PKN50_11340 [Spirochaetota bacterium]|nr:hypothetical protein [Spirochaetota bacterium]HPV43110.1 hypothetical protein [Spirochaetota bacterium]
MQSTGDIPHFFLIKFQSFIADYPCLRVEIFPGIDPAQDFNTDAVCYAGIKKEFTRGKQTVGIADVEYLYRDIVFAGD